MIQDPTVNQHQHMIEPSLSSASKWNHYRHFAIKDKFFKATIHI